jgi:hypothetical protein
MDEIITTTPIMMTSQEVIIAPIGGAQIDDLRSKLLICEESENDIFRFPRSKKP